MEWTDVLIWISAFWMFASVGVPTIIEFIYEKIASPETKLWKSIWSWLIPIILTYGVWVAGKWFSVGFLVGYEVWWVPAIIGGLAAAVSNYSWTNIPWIKEAILQLIALLPKTRETEEKSENE